MWFESPDKGRELGADVRGLPSFIHSFIHLWSLMCSRRAHRLDRLELILDWTPEYMSTREPGS